MKSKQRGDTIIEVMICMAILGFAMSICYGIARRGQVTVRQSEEHSQSLNLAQAQAERFRSYLSLNPNKKTDPGTSLLPSGTSYGFCIWAIKDPHTNENILKLIEIPGNKPEDTRCAVNEYGIFWCELEPLGDRCNGGGIAPDPNLVDADGFYFRAGIAYDYHRDIDQFYGLAGRYAVNGATGNLKSFDAVSIPFRIHQ